MRFVQAQIESAGAACFSDAGDFIKFRNAISLDGSLHVRAGGGKYLCKGGAFDCSVHIFLFRTLLCRVDRLLTKAIC